MAVPRRRTVVIEGPLAFKTRRLEAARNGECGLQIFNLPELAAHVAGGFSYPATKEILGPAIKAYLDEGGFEELDSVRHLPGMIRAVACSLCRAWNADVELDEVARRVGAPRIADLARIEQRLKRLLPKAALLARDLRNATIDHVHRAPAALGEVRLKGASWIAPLWRPLLNQLCRAVPTTWKAPAVADTSWFAGTAAKREVHDPQAHLDIVSCADPHHEAVEALRWLRALLSGGQVRANEIAIAAASTDAWDEYFLALTAGTGLRIHFSHGIPVLSTWDGQRCAALADVLLRGLSEARVRRLVSLCAGEGGALEQLPQNWLALLPRAVDARGMATGPPWHESGGRSV